MNPSSRRSLGPQRLLIASLLCLASTLWSATASAQTDKIAEARKHFDQGTEFFRQHRYEQALEELLKAYVLDPNPDLVYNIGRVHEERGDLESAIRFFNNYRTMAARGRHVRTARQKIRTLRQRLRRRRSQGTVTIRTAPPGAIVHVDGQILGRTPIVQRYLNPGRRTLEITKDGVSAHQGVLVVRRGENTEFSIPLSVAKTELVINTVPAGARATLYPDSPTAQDLGPCPCVTTVPIGDHTIRVTHPGHATRDLQVANDAGLTQVSVRLQPAASQGLVFVECAVPGAEVRVDGLFVGTTPLRSPVPARIGTVSIQVSAPGHASFVQTITVDGSNIQTVQATLQAQRQNASIPIRPPVHNTPAPQVVYRPTDMGASGTTVAGWTLTGIGIAGVLAGGICTSFVLYNQHEFDNATYFKATNSLGQTVLVRKDMTNADAQALEDETKALNYASIGLYAGGGALLLTGIILLATDSDPVMESLSDSQFQLSPLPGGAMVQFGLALD